MKSNNILSFIEMVTIIGNGDAQKGANLMQNLALRLNFARNKHKWGKEKEIDTPIKAHNALKSEKQEWLYAMTKESKQRQLDESLDILAVAIRIANREFEN